MKKCFTVLFVALLLTSAGFAQQSVTYTESTAEIQNPDRGFYTPINGVASAFTPLTATQLANLRNNPFTPWQGNYTVSPTIIFRHYVLAIFKSSALSASFLSGVQADFDAARTAGVRLMIRFSYTITAPSGSCGSWICPPYGDAPKSVVLGHIAQLKPYFQNNSDVILAVQNGFIGVWGEQYYTDYFGDASVQGKLTDQNWQDRLDVLTALLDAVPSNRMVQVRYPQMKQKLIYGINAPVTSAAITPAQAYNGTNIARVGFHNDCFLSATDDQGTYWDYGTSATSASDQTTILKAYAASDSQYGAVGGETCSDAFSPQNDCSGQAVTDLDLLNYSYLNSDYNNEVNSDWQDGGCMAEIKRRFGYRFVMLNGTFPTAATVGGSITVALNVKNVGFAAPFNPRTLKLVLRNTSTSTVYTVDITGSGADTRLWLSGQTAALNKTLTLPAGVPAGTYELLLHVSDMSNNGAVAARPEYSIQFANTGTWEAATGFNKLNATLTVSAASSAPAAPVNLTASAASASQINLSWSASAGATSYSVHRATVSGGPYTQVASGLTTTTYSNTGLSANTTYYYTVKATNAAGTSPASSQASATTSGGGTTAIVVDGNAGEWSAVPTIATNGTGGLTSLKVANSANNLYILAQGTSISTNYQLFIDTDNNTSGSNEYTDSDWTSAGFNFMVENGTLYQYTGTGTNWSWNTLGAVTAVKNATVLEASVPRSSLGTLAATIRVAVGSINSGWTMIGYVPASSTAGAPYTVGGAPAARTAAPVNATGFDKQEQQSSSLAVYPNPAKSVLHVQYSLGRKGVVYVHMVNVLGQEVRAVDLGVQEAGKHEATVDVHGLQGYYVLKVRTPAGMETQRVKVNN
ncbi:DUF4832 domain-containing protein [Dawidia soli]|uniref:DUF4832 domain-containing protein n=1 Tax=Dawidia soli TaxID=2782352 RepID=A0AAP2GER7_9BACT|nr:DUF4832 domain-containing protein [Dawidia soli]MBT1688687.1 DUF4832 domain-containing protein [Dawidia soli]